MEHAKHKSIEGQSRKPLDLAKLKRQISHTKFTAHQPPPPRTNATTMHNAMWGTTPRAMAPGTNSDGEAGFSFPGGGGGVVDRALWPDPPSPKRAQLTEDPQNPTESDPRALEVTRIPKSAKKGNGIFGISTSRGFRRVIICHIFGEKKSTNFSAQKSFRRLWRQAS